MKNGKIKFVREYVNDKDEKKFDIIYHSKAVIFVPENELPKTVVAFIKSAKKVTKQYDYTALRKNKNEIIYES